MAKREGTPKAGRLHVMAKDALDALSAVAKALVIGVAMVAAMFVWFRIQGARGRAIRAMPEAQRQALYSSTLHNLRSTCKEPQDAVRAFCEEQANLALELPECDGTCRKLAWQQLLGTHASR